MKLFGYDISISRPPASAPSTINHQLSTKSGSLAAAWLRADDLESTGPVLTNAYQQVVWVYRAINALADQVSNIPFLFSRGEPGRETLIGSGPLLDFYNRPHRHMNQFQYWEYRVIWLMLRGECFRIPIYEDRPVRPLSSIASATEDHASRRLSHILMLDPALFHHI